MSRLEYRTAVDLPRPLGAIWMVAIASATLAVTGQVASWALVLQALAIATALATRTRPMRWQRTPLVLNAGLACACAAGLASHLRGEVSTVAFAHFAMLGQGLQLLDARPRHSEFLLVALALFQVVLASNLTDSVWFPPLLVVFLLTAVWALLLHTLRQEALEAGDPAAARRAATPGLLQTTVIASLGAIVLAGLLFLALPRMRSSIVRAVGSAGAAGVSGFSERVELGTIGRIRTDPRVALRVETLSGAASSSAAAYWRGLAFDTFDGRAWSVSEPARERIAHAGPLGLRLRADGPPPERVERIVREATDGGVLFGRGPLRSLEGAVRRVERDANGNLYAPDSAGARIQYTLGTGARPPRAGSLARDRAVPPPGGARFLELPALSPAVRELADRVSDGTDTDAGRAAALERHLRETGRYTDTPPRVDRGDPRSPVEVFLLGGVAGHCEYFATAMAVMGRAIGLPTRLVTGYAGGRENRVGGFVELTRADAHAWVEIHFENAGWVRYDPTPPDLRLRAAAAPSLGATLLEVASAVELWWFRRVVEFDRNDQVRALSAGYRAWRRMHPRGAAGPTHEGGGVRLPSLPRGPALAALGLVALAVAAARLGGRGRRRESASERAYADALRVLARRGLVRAPATTPRAFARAIARDLPDDGARAFGALTETYLAARYGGRADAPSPALLRRLRASLRSVRHAPLPRGAKRAAIQVSGAGGGRA